VGEVGVVTSLHVDAAKYNKEDDGTDRKLHGVADEVFVLDAIHECNVMNGVGHADVWVKETKESWANAEEW
jgi:hypothetical protein